MSICVFQRAPSRRQCQGHISIPRSLRLLSLHSNLWDATNVFINLGQRINLVFMLQELGWFSYALPDDDPTSAGSRAPVCSFGGTVF
jgi:hypothetical protein